MNVYALAIGIIIGAFIIFRFRKSGLEKTRLAYPLLFASFPFYYFAFAIYAGDLTALYKETAVGLLFFVLAIAAIISKRKTSAAIVGIGCIAHAAYDAYHNLLFTNLGTPSWWVEFCGSIDLILGVYLLYFSLTTPNVVLKKPRQKSRCSDIA
jgi:hypothetical protein